MATHQMPMDAGIESILFAQTSLQRSNKQLLYLGKKCQLGQQGWPASGGWLAAAEAANLAPALKIRG